MYLRHGRNGRIVVRKIIFASDLTGRRGRGKCLHLDEGVGIFAGSGSLAGLPWEMPLDVVALDRDLRVLAVYPCALPARRSAIKAEKLLGLAPGAAARAGLQCGDTLELGLC
ncbi:MAG: uncharacterized protein PWR11_912 [Bacillota bacterium]|jgi:hypothetical protein|nr:uncharacterized protein [Bacillota bacterium]MDK2785046.1 uncharacterized protein [Bacillota bacterium]